MNIKTLGVALALGCTTLQPGAAAMTPAARQHASALSGAATLRQDMRKLWSDHVIWTRDYIVAALVTSRMPSPRPRD